MSKWLMRRSFSLLRWALSGVGAVALLLTALVAAPLVRPPELRSISQARGSVDFSALPPSSDFRRAMARCSASAIIPRAALRQGARPS